MTVWRQTPQTIQMYSLNTFQGFTPYHARPLYLSTMIRFIIFFDNSNNVQKLLCLYTLRLIIGGNVKTTLEHQGSHEICAARETR